MVQLMDITDTSCRHRCIQTSEDPSSVVTTIELSPPPRWLATIKPPLPPQCCTVFSAVFSAPFHDSFYILCRITDCLRLQLPGRSRHCTKWHRHSSWWSHLVQRRDRPLFVDDELWGVVDPAPRLQMHHVRLTSSGGSGWCVRCD